MPPNIYSELANWDGRISASPTAPQPATAAVAQPQTNKSHPIPPSHQQPRPSRLTTHQNSRPGSSSLSIPPGAPVIDLTANMAPTAESDSDNDSDRVNEMLAVTSPERPTPTTTPKVHPTSSPEGANNASKRVSYTLQDGKVVERDYRQQEMGRSHKNLVRQTAPVFDLRISFAYRFQFPLGKSP